MECGGLPPLFGYDECAFVFWNARIKESGFSNPAWQDGAGRVGKPGLLYGGRGSIFIFGGRGSDEPGTCRLADWPTGRKTTIRQVDKSANPGQPARRPVGQSAFLRLVGASPSIWGTFAFRNSKPRMPKLGVFSGKEICGLLREHGFVHVHTSGSHAIMRLQTGQGTITVPVPLHTDLAVNKCFIGDE